MKTIVLNFHPDMAHSNRIKAAVEYLKHQPNVTIREIATEYKATPEGIKAEQEILLAHDRIVFLYPIHWAMCPWLGKKYIDEVFQIGFSHVYEASTHCKLAGKTLRQVISVGAPKSVWPMLGGMPEGASTLPYKLMAGFTGMKYEEPFIFHSDEDLKVLEGLKF